MAGFKPAAPASRRLDAPDRPFILSGLHRVGRGKGRVPAVRPRRFPGGPNHADDGRRGQGGGFGQRHPQRPSDIDRADGDDFTVCGQCFLGNRTCVCVFVQPQGAAAGRLASRGRGCRLRGPALASHVRRPASARAFRRCPVLGSGRPCPHAGGGPEVGRQFDFQDDQLSRRYCIRGFPGRVHVRLGPGVQGMHDLSSQRGHGLGTERRGNRRGDSGSRPGGRGDLHRQATGPAGGAGGPHIQDKVAGKRACNLHYGQ